VALTKDVLKEGLATLKLQDLPGVGARTEKKLNEKGIHSMTDLMAVLDHDHGREKAGDLWGSVWGERMWHWLHGDDLVEEENEHAKSMGHQHVLAPAFRNPESAWAVAHKLLHKAAMRIRKDKLWASRIGLSVAFKGKGKIKGSSPFGPSRSESWSAEIRLLECQDNATLIGALKRLWEEMPQGPEHQEPFFLSVTLGGLVPDALHTLTLFDAQDGSEGRMRLAETMDALNNKYGLSTLAPATMLAAFKAAPTRIAFRSVPELFDHSAKGISNRL
jgi:DNA polymerase-4